jgi:hypothetical protein
MRYDSSFSQHETKPLVPNFELSVEGVWGQVHEVQLLLQVLVVRMKLSTGICAVVGIVASRFADKTFQAA